MTLQALWVSTGLVALAEMGDKTQLLAFMLAARFKRPLPIIAGIVLATLANHALAGAAGAWLGALLTPQVLRWILGASFLAMAAWMLVPDKVEEDAAISTRGNTAQTWGIFASTLLTFFLAEMGDKTQIATVAMAARYAEQALLVVLGTTFGMLLANVPAVYAGDKLAAKLPLKALRTIAAGVCALLGVITLLGWGTTLLTA